MSIELADGKGVKEGGLPRPSYEFGYASLRRDIVSAVKRSKPADRYRVVLTGSLQSGKSTLLGEIVSDLNQVGEPSIPIFDARTYFDQPDDKRYFNTTRFLADAEATPPNKPLVIDNIHTIPTEATKLIAPALATISDRSPIIMVSNYKNPNSDANVSPPIFSSNSSLKFSIGINSVYLSGLKSDDLAQLPANIQPMIPWLVRITGGYPGLISRVLDNARQAPNMDFTDEKKLRGLLPKEYFEELTALVFPDREREGLKRVTEAAPADILKRLALFQVFEASKISWVLKELGYPSDPIQSGRLTDYMENVRYSHGYEILPGLQAAVVDYIQMSDKSFIPTTRHKIQDFLTPILNRRFIPVYMREYMYQLAQLGDTRSPLEVFGQTVLKRTLFDYLTEWNGSSLSLSIHRENMQGILSDPELGQVFDREYLIAVLTDRELNDSITEDTVTQLIDSFVVYP